MHTFSIHFSYTVFISQHFHDFFTIFTHFTLFTLCKIHTFLPLGTNINIPIQNSIYHTCWKNVINISYFMPCLIKMSMLPFIWIKNIYTVRSPHDLYVHEYIWSWTFQHYVELVPSIGFSTYPHLVLHTITLTIKG